MVDPSVFLTWKCPRRAAGSRELKHIPVDVFEEIFRWLRPIHDPDMTKALHHRTMALLAPVCRYFTYYALQEESRSLDFDGQSSSNARTPTGTWCTGLIKQRQPMETFRKDIRECTIINWIPSTLQLQSPIFETFLKLFPRALPRLENLRNLKLCMAPISYALFDGISRLRNLEGLHISGCYVPVTPTTDAPPRTLVESPFPVLQQLLLAHFRVAINSPMGVLFSTLTKAPTLRSLTLVDSWWFPILYPGLSTGIISLFVHLTSEYIPEFVTYLHACSSLEHLAIFSQDYDILYPVGKDIHISNEHSLVRTNAEHFKSLKQTDFPRLRSFIGPLWLASAFVPGRPVSSIQLGFHSVIPLHDASDFSYVMDGFGLFASNRWPVKLWAPSDSRGKVGLDLEDLKKIGSHELQALSVPIFRTADFKLWDLALYFPHILHLQLQLKIGPHEAHKFLANVGDCLQAFQKLELLYLHIDASIAREIQPGCELSPGEQYEFVKDWKARCTTLTTVVIGSYMAWHWRRSVPPLSPGVSHSTQVRIQKITDIANFPKSHVNAWPSSHPFNYQWELEILSPRSVREALETKCQAPLYSRQPVRDWGGKLERILQGSPLISIILG